MFEIELNNRRTPSIACEKSKENSVEILCVSCSSDNQNKPTDGSLERKIIFLNSSKIRSPAMFDIKSCGSERMVSLSVRSTPKSQSRSKLTYPKTT